MNNFVQQVKVIALHFSGPREGNIRILGSAGEKYFQKSARSSSAIRAMENLIGNLKSTRENTSGANVPFAVKNILPQT